MGLDIDISTDVNDDIFANDYHDPVNDYFNKHSLSRTFSNFMCRQNLGYGEPELDQIGRITDVDISPLYQMETYQDDNDEGLTFQLEVAENEAERQHLQEEARLSRESLAGNIVKVLSTINSLIDKLSAIHNLPELLDAGDHDTLGYNNYFTEFNLDKGEGYIRNNFGQDLRNFKRFLEFAKERGARTVFFRYG